ncbi:hypothetical protein BN2475_830035 [Paraburkholderia ribeironis]|uniref:Uncharacterized protein n=1 Tax=Paraburkholderia ribeironis TaxID=1247936 RepID=A0A1N7SLN4_9BURK|nr:hypothetical protein BN2475_830035 [Paraburkholderia ribeironis]
MRKSPLGRADRRVQLDGCNSTNAANDLARDWQATGKDKRGPSRICEHWHHLFVWEIFANYSPHRYLQIMRDTNI